MDLEKREICFPVIPGNDESFPLKNKPGINFLDFYSKLNSIKEIKFEKPIEFIIETPSYSEQTLKLNCRKIEPGQITAKTNQIINLLSLLGLKNLTKTGFSEYFVNDDLNKKDNNNFLFFINFGDPNKNQIDLKPFQYRKPKNRMVYDKLNLDDLCVVFIFSQTQIDFYEQNQIDFIKNNIKKSSKNKSLLKVCQFKLIHESQNESNKLLWVPNLYNKFINTIFDITQENKNEKLQIIGIIGTLSSITSHYNIIPNDLVKISNIPQILFIPSNYLSSNDSILLLTLPSDSSPSNPFYRDVVLFSYRLMQQFCGRTVVLPDFSDHANNSSQLNYYNFYDRNNFKYKTNVLSGSENSLILFSIKEKKSFTVNNINDLSTLVKLMNYYSSNISISILSDLLDESTIQEIFLNDYSMEIENKIYIPYFQRKEKANLCKTQIRRSFPSFLNSTKQLTEYSNTEAESSNPNIQNDCIYFSDSMTQHEIFQSLYEYNRENAKAALIKEKSDHRKYIISNNEDLAINITPHFSFSTNETTYIDKFKLELENIKMNDYIFYDGNTKYPKRIIKIKDIPEFLSIKQVFNIKNDKKLLILVDFNYPNEIYTKTIGVHLVDYNDSDVCFLSKPLFMINCPNPDKQYGNYSFTFSNVSQTLFLATNHETNKYKYFIYSFKFNDDFTDFDFDIITQFDIKFTCKQIICNNNQNKLLIIGEKYSKSINYILDLDTKIQHQIDLLPQTFLNNYIHSTELPSLNENNQTNHDFEDEDDLFIDFHQKLLKKKDNKSNNHENHQEHIPHYVFDSFNIIAFHSSDVYINIKLINAQIAEVERKICLFSIQNNTIKELYSLPDFLSISINQQKQFLILHQNQKIELKCDIKIPHPLFSCDEVFAANLHVESLNQFGLNGILNNPPLAHLLTCTLVVRSLDKLKIAAQILRQCSIVSTFPLVVIPEYKFEENNYAKNIDQEEIETNHSSKMQPIPPKESFMLYIQSKSNPYVTRREFLYSFFSSQHVYRRKDIDRLVSSIIFTNFMFNNRETTLVRYIDFVGSGNIVLSAISGKEIMAIPNKSLSLSYSFQTKEYASDKTPQSYIITSLYIRTNDVSFCSNINDFFVKDIQKQTIFLHVNTLQELKNIVYQIKSGSYLAIIENTVDLDSENIENQIGTDFKQILINSKIHMTFIIRNKNENISHLAQRICQHSDNLAKSEDLSIVLDEFKLINYIANLLKNL